ncbi:hypothetical protein J2I46_24405 [Fibrella sp. HMF5405]|uniref:Uncharacterized protein n=2 Tax=Fibrella forsythiae TaxID=2817061 RepID=A0ABS3JP29_9BACT|nr:hypothetical protein [Fibrella forsythiae]
MDNQPINNTDTTKQQAVAANHAFDETVKQFLRDWIEQGTVSGIAGHEAISTATGTFADFVRFVALEEEIETFVEQGALRSFFKHHDDALERLLQQPAIASHLIRPGHDVFFEPDAYEPMLAKFERRIYNLAAHREHLEVPFRYSPTSRQGTHGDSIGWADLPLDHNVREDIGYYFGTRRSDATALGILGRQLHREAQLADQLPVHVVLEGHMDESLRAVKMATEQLQQEGDIRMHCFIIQRRHAHDDRHLGAALLLMNPAVPDQPQRIIFCDTLNPNGQPPWWESFKRKIDAAFPQPEGAMPVSDRLEDGGVNLQRLHDGVPVRHQDIDCAFYTASMARALIQTAIQHPEVILYGPTDAVVSHMTGRMTDYFESANCPKDPAIVREVNIIRRWNTGREALLAIQKQEE